MVKTSFANLHFLVIRWIIPGNPTIDHYLQWGWARLLQIDRKLFTVFHETSTNCVTFCLKSNVSHAFIYRLDVNLQHLQLFQSCLSILQSRKLRHPWQFPTGSLSWIFCRGDPPSCHSSWPEWAKWWSNMNNVTWKQNMETSTSNQQAFTLAYFSTNRHPNCSS